MNKGKQYSLVRYFDILAPPYYQKINEDHYKKKTVVGGLFSLFLMFASFGYLLYQLIFFYQGQISPRFNQYDEFKEYGFEYKIQLNSLFISLSQNSRVLFDIEKEKKIQYFDIYLQDIQNNQILQSSYSLNGDVYFLQKNQDYIILKSQAIPFQENQYIISIDQCSGNYLRDPDFRCATQNEMDQLLSQQDILALVILRDKTFSIQDNKSTSRAFLTYTIFNQKQKSSGLLLTKSQQMKIQSGFLFYSTEYVQQIYDFNSQNIFGEHILQENQYCEFLFQLDNMVRQSQVQYPQISEVFAQVWGLTSLLLLSGYIFKYITQATLAQDFLGIQLKYYYKKTALRLFGQTENVNQSNIELNAQAESISKQNEEIKNKNFKKNLKDFFKISNFQKWKIFFFPRSCLKRKKNMTENEKLLDQLIQQTNKDMCVFEMQKEFLKLRAAVKLLLSPEQYSAIHMCGCDLINDEQISELEHAKQNYSKKERKQMEEQNDNISSNMSASDIKNPINSYSIEHSIIQVTQERILNHLELMNKVDVDPHYRQQCLQRFLKMNQQNLNFAQNQINQRILDCIIGISTNENQQKIEEI